MSQRARTSSSCSRRAYGVGAAPGVLTRSWYSKTERMNDLPSGLEMSMLFASFSGPSSLAP